MYIFAITPKNMEVFTRLGETNESFNGPDRPFFLKIRLIIDFFFSFGRPTHFPHFKNNKNNNTVLTSRRKSGVDNISRCTHFFINTTPLQSPALSVTFKKYQEIFYFSLYTYPHTHTHKRTHTHIQHIILIFFRPTDRPTLIFSAFAR